VIPYKRKRNLNLHFISKKFNYSVFLVMAIPLVLSAFTHLFNPAGFPCVQTDEGIYMRRAMYILQGLGPQDPASRFDHAQVTTSSYDHPYFGPLFLASVLKLIGYPDSIINASSFSSPPPSTISPSSPNSIQHSIEMLYLVPRVLMGILAVVDTFLIYKIAERRYNRNIALIASILFAVMPLSWLIRRVYLDTILMPFLLSSILFALYNINNSWSNTNTNVNNINNNSRRKSKTIIPILLSGILLGLAIFTKIPAFTMVPLVGFLVYVNNDRNLKVLGLWFIPVILIPLIWPAYSILAGQYDEWLKGVLWQGTQRQESTLRGKENHLIFGSLNSVFIMDPVLVIVGITGVVFAVIIKRDLFLLFWIIPFLILSYLIGWITYFHYILVLPAFCIAAANLIEDIPKRVIRTEKRIVQRLLSYGVMLAIGTFGFISTFLLITTNFFPSQFAAAAFVIQTMQQNSNHSVPSNISNDDNFNRDVTIISSPIYSWIFKNVFGNYQVFHTRDSHPIETQKIILMADSEYRYVLSKTEVEDAGQIERLQKIYNNTDIVATFRDGGDSYNFRRFPYTNIKECPVLDIEIRKS